MVCLSVFGFTRKLPQIGKIGKKIRASEVDNGGSGSNCGQAVTGGYTKSSKPAARSAFTLIELLVTVAILAVLASLVSLLLPQMQNRAHMSASLNNLRQIGAGVLLYAGDHDFELPGRVTSGQKWPALVHEYLQDTKVYAAPGDPENFIQRGANPLSNARNETSYIMNGYNDIGTMDDETVVVRIPAVDRPGAVILLGIPNVGSRHFYMDMLEGGGNHRDVLNLTAYGDGSTFLFADGSARFLTEETYDHRMWLVNRDFQVP
jgi:prepilin-type N-terminal cleavage/methylation domain-containing protein